MVPSATEFMPNSLQRISPRPPILRVTVACQRQKTGVRRTPSPSKPYANNEPDVSPAILRHHEIAALTKQRAITQGNTQGNTQEISKPGKPRSPESQATRSTVTPISCNADCQLLDRIAFASLLPANWFFFRRSVLPSLLDGSNEVQNSTRHVSRRGTGLR